MTYSQLEQLAYYNKGTNYRPFIYSVFILPYLNVRRVSFYSCLNVRLQAQVQQQGRLKEPMQ